jgi:hypothetical protein
MVRMWDLCSLEVISFLRHPDSWHLGIGWLCKETGKKVTASSWEHKYFFAYHLLVGALNLGCFFIGIHRIVYITRLASFVAVFPLHFKKRCILATEKRLYLHSSSLCDILNRNCWKYKIMGHIVQASGLQTSWTMLFSCNGFAVAHVVVETNWPYWETQYFQGKLRESVDFKPIIVYSVGISLWISVHLHIFYQQATYHWLSQLLMFKHYLLSEHCLWKLKK